MPRNLHVRWIDTPLQTSRAVDSGSSLFTDTACSPTQLRQPRTCLPAVHRQPALIFALVTAAAIQIVLVAVPAIPLGIPAEWVWRRHTFPDSLTETAARFAPALFGCIALVFAARLGNSRISRHHWRATGDKLKQRSGPGHTTTALLLLLLILASWVWIKTIERCTPAGHRNLKSLWVLYDKTASGYFDEAVFHMESLPEFLAGYPARMQEGEVYHVGTHPPGLFIFSRAAIQLCRSIPQTSVVQQLIPRQDRDTFRMVESSAQLHPPLSSADLTALCLLSELTTLAAVLTVIPLYYLLRRCFNALVAWRAACLWATMPCLIIFLPKSDVLFTLTSTLTLALGVIALASTSTLPWRFSSAIGCGLTLFLGLLMSLAHLPVLALLGIVCCIRVFRLRKPRDEISVPPRTAILQCVMVFASVAATIVVAAVLFSLAFDCNLLTVWRLNLRNHAAFYDQHVRTAWKWLLVNPLELSLAVGLPVAVTAIVGTRSAFAWFQDTSSRSGTLGADLAVAVVLTVGLLWISARNSGEAARLWCFLTPWLLVLTAHVLRVETPGSSVRPQAALWWTLLTLQMLACIITTGRVNGFMI